MTSAENPVGIASQPFTTASPRAHIVFSVFSRTSLSLRADASALGSGATVPQLPGTRLAALGPPGRSPPGGLGMKALTILAIAAAALVGLAGPAVAQIQSEQDREFVRKALSGGLAEVELGQLAMDRAVNRAVRSYATRIVQDHNRATAEL